MTTRPLSVVILCALLCGCQKAPPPPVAAKAPEPPRQDANLQELLKRADAVMPKNAPDMKHAEPLGAAPPEKVAVQQGPRPGTTTYYGAGTTTYYGPGTTTTTYISPSGTVIGR